MIRLSGLQPDEIKIEFVGLRPGEKLYEELLADDELTMPTPHEKLRIAKARKPAALWVNKLLNWIAKSHSANESLIKTELAVWVEEYSPHFPAGTEITAVAAEQVTIH
jgi:FlaA1/EpsC-like NDP-sugar epimerase